MKVDSNLFNYSKGYNLKLSTKSIFHNLYTYIKYIDNNYTKSSQYLADKTIAVNTIGLQLKLNN
jgi:hypothetical protein